MYLTCAFSYTNKAVGKPANEMNCYRKLIKIRSLDNTRRIYSTLNISYVSVLVLIMQKQT